MQSPLLRRGFTMVEILMVVGIMAILATIIFKAIKPGGVIIKTNDLRRTSYANELTKTLNHYVVAHDYLPVDIPTGLMNKKPVCTQGITTDSSCVNLDFISNENYLPIDRDEAEPNANYLGYSVYYTDLNGYTAVPNNTGAIIAVGDVHEKQVVSKFVQSGTAAWGNSGFFSAESIMEDGYITFTVKSLQYVYAIGLSSINTNNNYTSIQYAAYINGSQLLIYENGTLRATIGTLTVNDTISIKRTGTTITYNANGGVLYTSTVASSSPLFVDAALLTSGTQIAPITMVANGRSDYITYSSLAGGSVIPLTDCSINQFSPFRTIKSDIDSWTNAGFASCQVITANGEISFTVANTSSQYVVGVSTENKDTNYTSIQYGLYINNNALNVYENGVNRGSFGTVSTGDTLAIRRTGTSVTYLKNNAVLYTSGVASTGNLLVDTSVYKNGSSINPIVINTDGTNVNISIIDLFGINLSL